MTLLLFFDTFPLAPYKLFRLKAIVYQQQQVLRINAN